MEFTSGIYQPLLDAYQQFLTCPDILSLQAYALEPGSPDPALQSHLSSCANCQQTLKQLDLVASTRDLNVLLPADAEADFVSDTIEKPVPAPGQIWTVSDPLVFPFKLKESPSAGFHTGLLRIFVIIELGPKRLGRFQELVLCPITEVFEMASNQDIVLQPQDSPMQERLMLEIPNSHPALSNCLQDYLGAISITALQAAQAAYQGLPHQALRGGVPTGGDSAHLKFRDLEYAQLQGLRTYMQVFDDLIKQSAQWMVSVTPKGIQGTTPQSQKPSFFAERSLSKSAPILAASTGAEVNETPASTKERLYLNTELILEFWVESDQLEFLCFTREQSAVLDLRILYCDHQGQLAEIQTDSWGSAFVPLAELFAGEQLIEFQVSGLDSVYFPFAITPAHQK